jgi:hypothetical protein
MKTATDQRIHKHVSVFYGRAASYSPGLVLIPVSGGKWEILDEAGTIGEVDAVFGTWPTERVACREALKVLRARFGEGTIPVWGAGAPNDALVELGYERGRVRWQWWPPRLVRDGQSAVGKDGMPEKHDS